MSVTVYYIPAHCVESAKWIHTIKQQASRTTIKHGQHTIHVGGYGQHSHLSLVVSDDRAAVVLDDLRKLLCIEVPGSYPARELLVPDAVVTCENIQFFHIFGPFKTVVTAQQHPVGLRQVRDLVALREREHVLLGLGRVLASNR